MDYIFFSGYLFLVRSCLIPDLVIIIIQLKFASIIVKLILADATLHCISCHLIAGVDLRCNRWLLLMFEE